MKNSSAYLSPTILLLLFLSASQFSYGQINTLNGKYLASAKIDEFIMNQMDSLHIPGLSIALVENEKMVYHEALGVKNIQHDKIDAYTLFEAASMTKTVFAYAVIKLAQKQILDLDTPLYKYFPYEDVAYDEHYKLITARMILSHTSGFPNWRSGELSLSADPGTQYIYSGEGFEYLGKVVNHITGKELQYIIQQEVFKPLSMKNSYLIKNEYVEKHLADGLRDNKDWGKNPPYLKPCMAYSLYTNAKDYAKFVLALTKEAYSPTSDFKSMFIPQLEYKPKKSVCLGIFMEQTPYGVKYYHSGNNYYRFTSNFEFYKDKQIGYVFFMNCNKKNELINRLNEYLTTGK